MHGDGLAGALLTVGLEWGAVRSDADLDQLPGLAERHVGNAARHDRRAVRGGDDVRGRDERAGALEGTVDEDVRDEGILAGRRVLAADDGLGGSAHAEPDHQCREEGPKHWHVGSNDPRA